METTKIDEYTLGVVKEEVVIKTTTYDVDFLLRQRTAIQQNLDDFTAARVAELAEVDELLSRCENLGITPRPEPPAEGGGI
uniref:Uncharacterized protein n=1 Tax=viral metagenome TaxID=1070528 RepID=A0A6H2A0F2_9ZZZZ